MRTRLIVAYIVATPALVLISAREGQVISAGDATVLVSERTGAGMDALGVGPIEVVGGCLRVRGSVIASPHGTVVVAEDPLTIDIPSYGTFTLGDEVQVGGGYALELSSDDLEPGPYEVGGVTVPAEFAQYDIFSAHCFWRADMPQQRSPTDEMGESV